MRLFVFSLLIFTVSVAQAQQKPAYTASIEGGLLKGNNGNSSVFLLSNGIRYKTITAGLGAGIDHYLLRSVPLFIDLKKDFGHRFFQPFFSYSAGINISAIRPEQKQMFDIYSNTNIRNGFYTRAMLGTSIRLHKKLRFFTGFAYSYKTTRVKYEVYNYIPDEHIDNGMLIRRMNRWSLTAGFQF